jgi:tetratricopeptide (TPR) repeat protein
MKLIRRIKLQGLRSGLVFCCFLAISLSLTQCSTKHVISGKDDYYMLDDLKKFEYEYSLHEGIKYKLLGDLQKSVFFFKRCLELFPFSDVSYFELSNLFYVAGEIDNAIFFAGKALEIDQGNIWYYYQLARFYREAKDYRKAIDVYENAIVNFPDKHDLYFELAAMYSSESEFQAALSVYDKLEKLIGTDERISLPREHIYMETGEFEKAYFEIQNLITRYPGEARYYGILAELYSSMQMYSEALESYKKLFELDPENGMAQLSISDFYIQRGKFDDAMYYLRAAFRNPGLEYSDKVQVYSALVQDYSLIENYHDKIEQLGLILIENYPERIMAKAIICELYIYTGEYARASDLLYELYKSAPDNQGFAEQLIAVTSFNEDHMKTIELGRSMINSFPGSGSIHYFLGIAYHNTDETDLAIKTFENALNAEGINQEMKIMVLLYLADLYNQIKDFKKSDRFFERILEIDNTNLIAMNNYAYYLALREERLDLAKEYSFRTVEKSPDNASYLDTYAWILYKLGHYEDALFYIELSYRNGGENSYDIVKHYGEILLKLGKFEEALEFLVKARELSADPEEVDEIINIIKGKN